MRAVLDVRDLPSVVYGSRVLTWWGTLGFMAAEAASLSAVLASYYYVMRSYNSWPPLRTPPPDLFVPTISLVVLIAVLVPTYMFKKAAEKLDTATTKRWTSTRSSPESMNTPHGRWSSASNATWAAHD